MLCCRLRDTYRTAKYCCTKINATCSLFFPPLMLPKMLLDLINWYRDFDTPPPAITQTLRPFSTIAASQPTVMSSLISTIIVNGGDSPDDWNHVLHIYICTAPCCPPFLKLYTHCSRWRSGTILFYEVVSTVSLTPPTTSIASQMKWRREQKKRS